MTEASRPHPSLSMRVLGRIEKALNTLPDPVFIFLYLILALIAVSVWADLADWQAINPSTGKVMAAESLLSASNVNRLLVDMPKTLTAFPPLGLVLVVMLGASIAERSGLFAALFRRTVRHIPKAALSPAIFLIGLMSHHAADAAYVVLIPLSALVYHQAGRNPLAGIAIAYAGISGAFAGNILPGQFDVLILGITQAAAQLIDPTYPLNPLGNWWFTLVLGLCFLPVAWFITDRIVEPRLGPWTQSDQECIAEPSAAHEMSSPSETQGLKHAAWAGLAVVALFAGLTLWPGYQPLIDNQATGGDRMTPFYKALVAGFMLLFLMCGWAYGRTTGTIRSDRDMVSMMSKGMAEMAPYLVLVFFAAHFVAMFSWSNLGPVLAIKGAEWLRQIDLPKPALLVTLLSMSSVFDLVIGSASAKWSAMAPIVVPMLMLVGISPEMTTAASRMGDSIFNIVTPVASNFALVLILAQRWRPSFGIGSLVALMLPYSLAILVTGLALVSLWVGFGLPVGPDAPAAYSITAGHASPVVAP